jgi:hypothetical protein
LETIEPIDDSTPKLGGCTGKGFLPGQSGNPGGRPKSLASYIKEVVGDDGHMLVDFHYKVLTGQKINGKTPTLNQQIQSSIWLADRGFGKPVQAIDTDLNVNCISLEDLIDDTDEYQNKGE